MAVGQTLSLLRAIKGKGSASRDYVCVCVQQTIGSDLNQICSNELILGKYSALMTLS